jgi:hypothetical protein
VWLEVPGEFEDESVCNIPPTGDVALLTCVQRRLAISNARILVLDRAVAIAMFLERDVETVAGRCCKGHYAGR